MRLAGIVPGRATRRLASGSHSPHGQEDRRQPPISPASRLHCSKPFVGGEQGIRRTSWSRMRLVTIERVCKDARVCKGVVPE
ncbi:hypothetical protein ASD02_28130 [Ensifer sp. Root1252]|nr:hypothetical protein ASD00_22870 [Ensifer sp. Root31]KQW59131.1 hypothetical protein ASD02_28130 [Ensifer sp. Root1252]KQW79462.1 hypothetical protein ASD03_25175 [Ensifer sp. Root127]KRC74112.1 hypothetical protein ASE32_31885 [Ensifer sp. Root231]KRC97127.1 hypothetical protein ASE47_29865 [Ensifer sp. Root258]PSS60277.1 hypothetical protein C6558_33815 [Ensifer sp. NM-2]